VKAQGSAPSRVGWSGLNAAHAEQVELPPIIVIGLPRVEAAGQDGIDVGGVDQDTFGDWPVLMAAPWSSPRPP